MKTTVCDICNKVAPEVKAHAKETLNKRMRYLWTYHEKIVTEYDICFTCWCKILNNIKPLDINGRRKGDNHGKLKRSPRRSTTKGSTK